MNKKIVGDLAVGAVLILLVVVLYHLLTDNPSKTGPSSVTVPGAPTATAPAKPEPIAAAPTQPTTQAPPAAPGIAPAGPPQGVAPSPEPQITVLRPAEAGKHYGILAGSYGKYRDAAKMQARLKKQGKPVFIQRDARSPNLYQVWLGPFSSQNEAREVEKSLQVTRRKPFKIEPIENPVPK
jgi:cell division protein FtsN